MLVLVAQGRADPAIAAKLGLGQRTIRNHVSNVLTRLQVAGRAQTIVQARDAGLGHKSRIWGHPPGHRSGRTASTSRRIMTSAS